MLKIYFCIILLFLKNIIGYSQEIELKKNFVFGNADDKTPAHEIGHGIFKLEHPWNILDSPKGKSNLLMDYSKGTLLSYLDWKQINNPKIKLYSFQNQSEGEFSEIRLTPDWIPFEYKESSTHGNINAECFNNGGICSIEKNGLLYSYDSTQKDYFNKDKKLGISVVQNPEYVIVVDYSVGCGKLYKVKFKDLQAYFKKDSHIDFNNKIFSHYGDVACKENDNDGDVVDFSGKMSKEKLQQITKSLNITNGETGIKGKIFITNATDKQHIEKVKSALNELENSSKKEIYLWANYVDGERFTIDFAVGGGVENRDRIIKNREVFKKIPSISDLPWGGKINPLAAIFDGLAYLVSYLEIPPKFYDPTIEEYNPILYEIDKSISQYSPADITTKEIIKQSGINTEKGVTPGHLAFAYRAGLWNGLVGSVKSIPELASLLSKGIQLIYDEEFRNEFSENYKAWKENCDNYNDSDTYAGCAWDMLWEHIKQAHTTGSSPQIAQQYGKSTIDVITIPLTMVKAGKLGKINKIMDLLDPMNHLTKFIGKGVNIAFNRAGKGFKYIINTTGKNFKRYELRFKIDGNTLYCGIPNGKISIIDKLKQADIEKLPVDENGIRIADIDGEAIPIGNKNALEKIEEKGVKIFSENLNTTISNLKKKAKYVLEGTGEYEKVGGHHPLAKKAFEGIEEYDYKKAFSVSKEALEEIGDIGIHNKVTGQQKSLYTEWRKNNPDKILEIDEMADIEIQAMVNSGIPEDIATGWVVKALEELKEKGIKSIKNIPWNGTNN